MAKIEIKKGSIEWDIHQEYWDLHKEYGEVEKEQSYWDSLAKAMGDMSKEYHDTDMSVMIDRILIAFAEWQDSKVSKQTENHIELLAKFLIGSRSKEEVEKLIKALQKGVEE